MPFVADVRDTAARFPVPDLPNALNKNQVASKRWLVDALFEAVGPRLGTVYILGGWYGFLGAMLLHDGRFQIDRVLSFDINPDCRAVAESLNRTHVEAGKFRAVTADVCELDYHHARYRQEDGSLQDLEAFPQIIINTSCEHLERFQDWYRRIPVGVLQVLQSNNDFACEVHVSCVPDLESFKLQAPLEEILFQGTLKLKHYDRFMLIGRKLT